MRNRSTKAPFGREKTMRYKPKIKQQFTYATILGLAILTNLPQPVLAATAPGVASKTEKSWFLQQQYDKSKLPQTDSLLAPMPDLTNSDEIEITPPKESDLVVIGSQKLHPIKLEATISKSTNLEDLLELALQNNLTLKISKDTLTANRYYYVSSLGKFLPDLSMTYKKQNLYQDGDLSSKITTKNMTLTYAFFQGGKVYFDSRAKYFDYKASKYSLGASKNDIMLDVFKKYNNVLYNQLLLHIRVKSLESSRAALAVNNQLMEAGTGTKYAVMQSKTQVASDAQQLVSQEVALRKANIDLAALLNQSLFENLVPEQKSVTKRFLLNPSLDINQAITIALANRPELKQYDSLRIAAQANTYKSASALLPTAQIYLSPNNTSISTGSNSSAGSSSNTNTNAGGTTGASNVNLSTTGSGTTSVGLGNALGTSVSFGGTLSWNLTGLGVTDTANTVATRALARRSLQQYNQQRLSVIQDLRKSYIDVQTAEQQIEIANEAVEAARESLRLASIRLKVGTGTNLEFIQSQKSYVDALSSQGLYRVSKHPSSTAARSGCNQRCLTCRRLSAKPSAIGYLSPGSKAPQSRENNEQLTRAIPYRTQPRTIK